MDARALADELLAAYDGAQLIPLPSERPAGLSVAQAYDVGDRLRTARLARGERALGYKIGFTNRSIWPRYKVFEPIWAPVWDSTVQLLDGTEATVSLQGLVQPRIEPEIVFAFASAPRAGMDERELAACLAWVAHGYELVHTHYEGWRFTAADTVADFALHGRLLVGPRVPLSAFAQLGEALAAARAHAVLRRRACRHGRRPQRARRAAECAAPVGRRDGPAHAGLAASAPATSSPPARSPTPGRCGPGRSGRAASATRACTGCA